MIPLAREPMEAQNDAVRTMDRVQAGLQRAGHTACDKVTRPDALVVAAWRAWLAPEGAGEQRS